MVNVLKVTGESSIFFGSELGLGSVENAPELIWPSGVSCSFAWVHKAQQNQIS